ncbi:NifB/NifX family molybdenum-iron cluster-binding protein [Geoglobus sp.]
MTVAIPTDDGKRVSSHFGRARYFYITDGTNAKLVENPHREHAGGHGAGRHHRRHEVVELFRKENVKKVLALHLGEGMRRNLEEAGVEIEIVKEADIEKLVHGSG